MTTQKKIGLEPQLVTEEAVAAYLKENPRFFVDHPDLLAELDIRHASGDAVSLLERQVAVLRDRNRQLHGKLRELVEIARGNEELARRMHRMILNLMDADNPDAVFHALREHLRSDFKADVVIVRVFAKAAGDTSALGEEFVGKDVAEKELFEELIAGGQPLCGRLKRKQQAYLFGSERDDIASAVLVPLHGVRWGGVMAIGSFDPQRFHPGMGVELLANMSDIISLILSPWIAA
ncbi:MAG: DUF484 family protein [Gammaproteobacteria bacterium]|nr:DUF484 family protein [Gammaproteobacteria bacterium]